VLQISRQGRSETLLTFYGFQQSGATLVRPADNQGFCLCFSSSVLALGSLRTLSSCSGKFYLLTFTLSAKLSPCCETSVYRRL